jgi:hypothetical protein
MIPRLIVGLVVVGLAIGVWAFWPQDEPEPSPTTTVNAVGTTSTTTVPPSTTTTEDSHVVTTVEEAEEILRGLWFGWFEGIYTQDEDRIKEVVATKALLEDARDAFGAPFTAEPTSEAITFSNTEILRSDDECLVTWGTMNVSAFRGVGAETQNVVVMRELDGEWRIATTWIHKEDLWEADCAAALDQLS